MKKYSIPHEECAKLLCLFQNPDFSSACCTLYNKHYLSQDLDTVQCTVSKISSDRIHDRYVKSGLILINDMHL